MIICIIKMMQFIMRKKKRFRCAYFRVKLNIFNSEGMHRNGPDFAGYPANLKAGYWTPVLIC